MLIRIDATYRGRRSRVLKPGEHEVSDDFGRYLIENFNGEPFFARVVETVPVIETKPAMPAETKPAMPAATKAPRKPRAAKKEV